jgi:hypothetical protein
MDHGPLILFSGVPTSNSGDTSSAEVMHIKSITLERHLM